MTYFPPTPKDKKVINRVIEIFPSGCSNDSEIQTILGGSDIGYSTGESEPEPTIEDEPDSFIFNPKEFREPEETRALVIYKNIEEIKEPEKVELKKLEKNKTTLEVEKEKFLKNLNIFINASKLDKEQFIGRPRAEFSDIIKCFLVMSFNSMSYRRSMSDFKKMQEEGIITKIPPKSTLNGYANNEETREILSKLIQDSALFFLESEDTLIFDSTWFGFRMYSGGYKDVHDKASATLTKCRKIHVVCLKNSKAIVIAKPTAGTVNDNPLFKELLQTAINNEFRIKKVIADAGYISRENYSLCQQLGIEGAYIDFRSNMTGRNPKSVLFRRSFDLFKDHNDIWHEEYRFRVIIEGVFSAIKRKNVNFLRSKTDLARDVELLLKVLVYNLNIIGKYS